MLQLGLNDNTSTQVHPTSCMKPAKFDLETVPPHTAAIGVVLVSTTDNRCVTRLPYAEHLIGDPDSGTIHGGAITAMLDNASGWAIRCHEEIDESSSMATLDLRIEYMRPALPGLDLIAVAEAHKLTRSIAFVRGYAHQGDPDDPVASSSATFMLGTRNEPRS